MRLIRGMSVRTRLLAALLLVSLAPATLVGVFANKVYSDLTVSEFSSYAEQTVGGMDSSLSSELGVFARMIDQSSVDDAVQSAMIEKRGNISLRLAAEGYLVRNRYMRGLCVFDADGALLYASGPVRVESQETGRIMEHIDSASPNDALCFYAGSRGVNAPPADCLILGRKIFRFSSGRDHIGYIMAAVDCSLAGNEILGRAQLGGGSLLMATGSGIALAGEGTVPGDSILDEPVFQGMADARAKGDDSFMATVDGERVFYAFSEDADLDVVFLASVPLESVGGSARRLQRQTAWLVLATTLSSVALSTLVFRSIAQPINRIVEQCRAPSPGGVGDVSQDELGFLARAVDEYAARLDAMAKAREADMGRKREMELETLQYQINPHFLFNTLGTLKWAAVMEGGPPIVSEGLSSLTRLLKNVLMNKDEMITLRDELDNLRHYFVIQKIRYADYFHVEYRVDDDALDCLVPRFIMQPLAENAVLHGTEGGRRRIVVGVRCELTDEGVRLEINDNGGGFDVERATAKNKHASRFSGIGLSNVDERLRLYYGEGYGLKISSELGMGTVCAAIIPTRATCLGKDEGQDGGGALPGGMPGPGQAWP